MAQVAGLTKSMTALLPKILNVLSLILVMMVVNFFGRKKIVLTTLVLTFFSLIGLGLLLGKMGGVGESEIVKKRSLANCLRS